MVHSRLLDVAIREFGSKGLDGASTRCIAAAAGTAMSSITYHYGGKDGLYLATADHIAAQMQDALVPMHECRPLPADAAGARDCIHQLLGYFFGKMYEDEDTDSALFILREQMNPTTAFDRLYDGPMGRMVQDLVDLIGSATGARRPIAEVNAILLFGQVIVWRATRALAARVITGDGAGSIDLIRQQLAQTIDAILDRLTADTQEPL